MSTLILRYGLADPVFRIEVEVIATVAQKGLWGYRVILGVKFACDPTLLHKGVAARQPARPSATPLLIPRPVVGSP